MEQQLLEQLSVVNLPELQAKVLWLKLLFLLVTAFFLSVIIVAFARTPYFRLSVLGDAVEVATFRPFGYSKIRERWKRIMRRLESANVTEYKLAVIETDLLLDETLKRMRLAGQNVDERLEKVTPFMVENLEELRQAHQVRNSVVYDPDYQLPLGEARRVLLVYQKAFENLDLFR